jgi:hypothetical protein
MDVSRGTVFALAGVALFVATMTVGAVTAPDRTIENRGFQSSPPGTSGSPGTAQSDGSRLTGTDPSDTGTDGSGTRTLVGMQGTWEGQGSVFALDGGDETWRFGGVNGYFEVFRLDNGTIAAAFSNKGAEECGAYDAPCARTGFHLIDPTAKGGPEIVAEYSFPVRRQLNREVHAVDATENGFVFTDMDRERIALVENGTVVWEWHARSLYDAPPDPTKRDWLHVNDVDVIGDGRFLVSVRNANQIVVVERGAGVVEVINEDRDEGDDGSCTQGGQLADFDDDGEVRCGDPDVINHQHNPQWLGDGAVLVADSDNDRVVELHRNETTGTWEPVWVVRETSGIDLNWPRDADRLPNGNTLITDSLGKRIVEVTPNGTAVWSVPTDRIPYEADRLPYGEVVGGGGDAISGAPTPTSSQRSDEDGTVTGNAPESTAPGQDGPELAQLTASDPGNVDETGSDVPVLSPAVAGLQGVSPLVPFWFRELHLALTIVSVVLVLSGSADLVLTRYRK